MKILYSFEIPKEIDVIEPETSKDEQGNEVITNKKVKKSIPQKFFVRIPTNSLRDDCNIFYCKVESFLKRQGIDTIMDVDKRLQNQGGILSDTEKELQKTLILEGSEIQKKLDELLKIKEEERTEENKNSIKDLSGGLGNILSQLQNLSNKINDAYRNTVETIARDKMLLWWVLYLSFKEESGKQNPVFGNGSFEDRKNIYDGMEESDDEFNQKLIKKIILVINAWIYGRCDTKEEFDAWILVAENTKTLNLAA